jgi:hypothetical protein
MEHEEWPSLSLVKPSMAFSDVGTAVEVRNLSSAAAVVIVALINCSGEARARCQECPLHSCRDNRMALPGTVPCQGAMLQAGATNKSMQMLQVGCTLAEPPQPALYTINSSWFLLRCTAVALHLFVLQVHATAMLLRTTRLHVKPFCSARRPGRVSPGHLVKQWTMQQTVRICCVEGLC